MTLDFYPFSSYNLTIKNKGDKKMKNNLKKIIALFSAASLLFLGACSNNPVKGTDFKNQTAEVNVDDFTAEFIFGENGLVEKEKKFYDNQEITYEYYECYEYNEKDQITKRYATDLEGNITSHTDAEAARQLGTYDTTSYYGPKFLTTYATTVQAGVRDALLGMHAGGYKKALVPSWLMTAKEFSSAKDYLDYHDSDNSTSYTPAIYEFEVVDFTDNVAEWQIDSIGRFFSNNSLKIDGKIAGDVFNGMAAKDSVSYGFYYKQLSAPVSTEEFAKDTTVYINYTGKLLNGLVFDTTIEKVAKENGLYSESRTYAPVRINWGEKYSDVTMGSDQSSIISGFALTLWQMKAMEKGVGVFYSDLGYGYSGSGSSIPGYASLIFEIELVENPNK